MSFCYPLHFNHGLPKYKTFGKQKVCCKFVTDSCRKFAASTEIECKLVSGKVFVAKLPQVQNSYANQSLENCLQNFVYKQYNEQPQNMTT